MDLLDLLFLKYPIVILQEVTIVLPSMGNWSSRNSLQPFLTWRWLGRPHRKGHSNQCVNMSPSTKPGRSFQSHLPTEVFSYHPISITQVPHLTLSHDALNTPLWTLHISLPLLMEECDCGPFLGGHWYPAYGFVTVCVGTMSDAMSPSKSSLLSEKKRKGGYYQRGAVPLFGR